MATLCNRDRALPLTALVRSVPAPFSAPARSKNLSRAVNGQPPFPCEEVWAPPGAPTPEAKTWGEKPQQGRPGARSARGEARRIGRQTILMRKHEGRYFMSTGLRLFLFTGLFAALAGGLGLL